MHAIQRHCLPPLLLFVACGGPSHGHGEAGVHSDASEGAEPANDAAPRDGAGATGEAAAAPTPTIGDACTDASTCPMASSGTTTCLISEYPGGYCAIVDCATHGHDCPGDATISKCVLAPTAVCLRLCATDADCRQGYACVDAPDAAEHGSYAVCIPS